MKRDSDAIYLGYGLLIGVALAIVGIAIMFAVQSGAANAAAQAASPADPASSLMPAFLYPATTFTAAPTPSFTPTPTYTVFNPTPTVTPTFTSTPAPTQPISEQMLLSGELTIIGPLSKEQQMRLYEESLRYIALTTNESEAIGETFAGKGYGSPTLICGPLSIAILQSVGLVDKNIVKPLDFWLLNPFLSKDRALANRAMPPDRYEHHQVTTPIRDIDYGIYPLYPGDFLYIKHGSGGTFDHMLVVNRVDSTGRAYSVTNYQAEQGFIINEVMLYDPNDSSAGIFKKWTAQRNSLDGATGFGGFELWRPRKNP